MGRPCFRWEEGGFFSETVKSDRFTGSLNRGRVCRAAIAFPAPPRAVFERKPLFASALNSGGNAVQQALLLIGQLCFRVKGDRRADGKAPLFIIDMHGIEFEL